MKVWIIAVALLILPAFADATTYYVRTDGADSNDGLANVADGVGTTGQAWLTIGKALTTIACGDTAMVQDGTYNVTAKMSSVRDCTAGSWLKIVAQNHQGAIIIYSSSGESADVSDPPFVGNYCQPTFDIHHDYHWIDGFYFKHIPGLACPPFTSRNMAVRSWSPCTGHVVRYSRVDADASFDGAFKSNCDDTLYEYNTIAGQDFTILTGFASPSFPTPATLGTIVRHNTFTGTPPHSGSAIISKGFSYNVEIYDNLIDFRTGNTTSYGIGVYLGGNTGASNGTTADYTYECLYCVMHDNVILGPNSGAFTGISTRSCSNCAAFNNVVIGMKAFEAIAGGNASSQPWSNGFTAKNNILSCTGFTAWSAGSATNVVFDYNDFFNCVGTPTQAHPIVGDPLLTSDWHLNAGSPAIAKGTVATFNKSTGTAFVLNVDYGGTTRTAPWDLGVYDQQVGTVDTTPPATPLGLTVTP